MKHEYKIEDLVLAVKGAYSIAGVHRILSDEPFTTTIHRRIKQVIEDAGIDTSHFTGQGWSKGQVSEKRKDIHYFLKPDIKKSTGLGKRLIKAGIKEHKCECCGITEWMGKEAPLELHHIDGNNRNNALENLELLCSNCHAQTDNFRGKNKSIAKERVFVAEDVMIKAINESFSISEVLRTVGLVAKGANFDRPRRLIKEGKATLKQLPQKEIVKRANLNKQPTPTPSFVKPSARPAKEILEIDIANNSFLEVGRKYGVSDNAVRKWCRALGIPLEVKNKRCRGIKPQKEELEEYLRNLGKKGTCAKIMCSDNSLEKWIEEYEIDWAAILKNQKDSRRPSKEDFLKAFTSKPISHLPHLFKTNKCTIYAWLEYFGIPTKRAQKALDKARE